ncbi:hypothetical protein ANN_10289 [Periplaneta americana]|uniref:Uncharacterized protein n=1 Tax=Periplaneta americana TaxID=6978 RepID=A0ABQ8TSH6_PERAM|nr:hypothetical protein ANN_10289 [Periplaneta americana]
MPGKDYSWTRDWLPTSDNQSFPGTGDLEKFWAQKRPTPSLKKTSECSSFVAFIMDNNRPLTIKVSKTKKCVENRKLRQQGKPYTTAKEEVFSMPACPLRSSLSPEHVRPPSPWTSSASFPNAWVPHGRGVRPPASVHPTNVSAPFPFETEQQRLRVFEKKVLRKIFGANGDEITGEWRKLHNAELDLSYSSPDLIRDKTRHLRWAGHVARMGESRNAYRVLVGRSEGKRSLRRPSRRGEDNIKMDLREVGYDRRDWINFAKDKGRWRAYVRVAKNLRVP